MGCGNAREDLEDQIMLVRLQRMKIQMEREKSFKQLSELEGMTINIDNISDYLAKSGKIKNIKLEPKDKNDKVNENNKNELNYEPQYEQIDSSQLLIEDSIQKNINKKDNLDKNQNINQNQKIDQNIIDVNEIPSFNIDIPRRKSSKKRTKTKRRLSKSLLGESNIININNNNSKKEIRNSGKFIPKGSIN